uniref:NECAP-like protein CG9132 n=1 Tax=Dermatophagoides pteronyssinus TaxID=6956 RepID=A0A6P6XPK4_DERPT|nr:NECAP-like protein CG9132 [Dermatophagoides pteronyssinus]
MDDYERILLVKPDVHVYKIPPRVSNRAYRASDWNLDAPDWNCRLRLIAKGDECFIKLDEKSTGQFFGKCPVDKYPGMSIEPVSDSSRYFVLRLVNEQTNRTAFVGIGFIDRSDSFDLNVALQDHFKIVQMEHKNDEIEDNGPQLDLKFKEGETIKVNLNIGNKIGSAKPRPKSSNKAGDAGGFGILLPPPPGSKTISSNNPSSNETKTTIDNLESLSESNLLDDIDSLHISNSGNNVGDKNENLSCTMVLNNKQSVDEMDQMFKFVPKDSDGVDLFADNNSTKTATTSSKLSTNDLWSNFTSCNTSNTTTNNPITSQSKTITETFMSSTNDDNDSITANQFDDWAKF